MELKLFTDLIDALSKVASGLKALVELPRKEKEKYRQTPGDTFRLIDTTPNMVLIPSGDILLLKEGEAFLDDVTGLDNCDE
jgi:hypothetical protein